MTEEDKKKAVIDYGHCIKDLAQLGIFQGDYLPGTSGSRTEGLSLVLISRAWIISVVFTSTIGIRPAGRTEAKRKSLRAKTTFILLRSSTDGRRSRGLRRFSDITTKTFCRRDIGMNSKGSPYVKRPKDGLP